MPECSVVVAVSLLVRALDNKKIDKSVYDRVIADAIEAYIQAKKREVPVVIITELLVAN